MKTEVTERRIESSPRTDVALARLRGGRADRAAVWAPLVVIGGAAVAMAWWTWGTWPDPFIDFGRELYVPWQLTLGKVLGRDVVSFYGPLSPHVNALWFEWFGTGLRSLVMANLALIGALLYLLFRIFRTMSDAVAATTACLTFVGLFAFGQLTDTGNYNFVTPYSHEMTHGIILSVAAIFALGVHLRSARPWPAAAAGLALGLTFLTKPEVFAAAAPAVTCGFVGAEVWGRRPDGRFRLEALVFGVGLAAPAVVAFLCSWRTMPAEQALAVVLGSWPFVFNHDVTSLVFFRRVAGLERPGESLRVMVVAARGYLAVFGVAAAVAIALGRTRARVETLAAAVALFFSLFALLTPLIDLDQVARPLPFLMAGVVVFWANVIVRRRADAEAVKAALPPLIIAFFSLLLLAKVGLNVHVYHYGFALAMPATLVLVVALVDWIPKQLAAIGGSAAAFRAMALGVWAIVMLAHLEVIDRRLVLHVHPVGQGADRFLADVRGVSMEAAVTEVERRLAPDQTVVALPEGIMLNYLTRRASSVRYPGFLPSDVMMFGEGRLLTELQSHSPDYVALVDRPTDEFGFAVFGRDYGRDIAAWIHANYSPVTPLADPPSGGRFGVQLLRRVSGHLKTGN